MPRSASIISSLSVTSTVPFIGELIKPIFALSWKLSVDPCQLFCFTTSRTGSPAASWDISFNERSTASMAPALVRLCATVMRMFGSPMRYGAPALSILGGLGVCINIG